ncbi:hypothetical protein ACJMK2_038764 [Sinanodonta woodiana]|uniref:Uncharacterized protein n=1 Tax=Sinanodonta woodiana TaxID=1069815 RepID=A0ABD3WB14_SINWO
MDRPVIFLQFLLMLMGARNVLSDCKCGKKSTIKEAICSGQTLIMASPESKEHIDANGNTVTNENDAYMTIYNMNLNVIYNEGLHKMGEKVNFELVTGRNAEHCGVELELNTDYYFAGTVLKGKNFLVHSCDYVEHVPWTEKTTEEIEQINDLLTRQIQLDCRKSCKIVTKFDVILVC